MAGKVKGNRFQPYHLRTIQQFRQFAQCIPSESNFIVEIQNNIHKVEQKYLSEPIFEGFPCFFIPHEWQNKFKREYQRLPKPASYPKVNEIKQKHAPQMVKFKYPGPITYFSIVNEIFEFIPYDLPKKQYLNKILFPGNRFTLVSKSYHDSLRKSYGDYSKLPSLKRLYKQFKAEDDRKRSRNQNYIGTALLAIKYKEKIQVFQFSLNQDPNSSVFPFIRNRYGFGQLKKKILQRYMLQNQQNAYEVVSVTRLKPNLHNLKFFRLNEPSVVPANNKLVQNLLNNFDLQTYKKEKSFNKGIMGLDNCGNSCYMGSSLQCLNSTHQLCKYLIQTYLLNEINYTKSSGQIACALADLFKKMWMISLESSTHPDLFKETFGKRCEAFAGKTQEDAHQFLNFLLNSVHDDLNRRGSTSFRRETLHDTTDLQKVKSNVLNHYQSQNDTIISRLMKGSYYNQIKCRSCEAITYSFDIFLILSLPLPHKEIKTIQVNFVGCQSDQCEAKQYSINAKRVDSISKIFSIMKNVSSKKENRVYFMLAVNKKSKKIEKVYLDSLQNQVSSEAKNYEMVELNELQKTAELFFYEIEANSDSQTYHLTLITHEYSQKRYGFHRLKYLNIEELQKNQLQLIKFAASTIPESTFRHYVYSASRAADKIDVVTIQPLSAAKTLKYIMKIDYKYKIQIEVADFQDSILENDLESRCTLQDCFQVYSRTEIIELDQQWKCEKCKIVTRADKRESIYQTKNILIISLQRFKAGQKNTLKIDYPLRDFDITKWIHHDAERSFFDPNRYIYELYAVCLHYGSLDRGHYISFCKSYETGKWYRYDDELVTEIEEREVVNDSAYILFYRSKNMGS